MDGTGDRRTILVTGAGGFVGRPLCAGLSAAGFVVRKTSRRARPGHLATGPFGAATDWSAALAGCDAVVHLAARAHEGGAAAAALVEDNVRATVHLAEQAAVAGVRRLVFVSTAKVHGAASPAGRPLSEADAPEPADAYGRSKLMAEQGLHEMAARDGLEVVVIRPPLVHGPGAKAHLALLLRAIDRGWPLPLAAVRNRRSLVGVDNLCGLIALAIDHPAAAGETFLAADGDDLATPELIRRLARLLGRPARLLPVPPALLRAGFGLVGRGALATSLCGDFRVDAGKARRLLGWEPAVGLDDGLAAMVAAYRAAKGNP